MKKSWNFSELLETVTTVCFRAGYPIREIEYESAINSAVGEAITAYGPDQPSTIYCTVALHECLKVKEMFVKWSKQDAAGAGRGLCEQPVPTPIPLLSFEILSFVARHGRTRAARMLGLSRPRINEMIDDISREMDAIRLG